MGETSFGWEVCDIGVKVAALMTEAIIMRRLARPISADRIILPGRCRADLARLSNHLGVVVTRGPDELSDLPVYLGRGGQAKDLSGFSICIFAEIVDASALPVAACSSRAAASAVPRRRDRRRLSSRHAISASRGVIRALKAAGHLVSVDSADRQELARGAKAGADFLLSLDKGTLDIAEGTGATPILDRRRTAISISSCPRRERRRAARDFLYRRSHPRSDPFRFSESLTRYVETEAPSFARRDDDGTESTELTSGSGGVPSCRACSELDIRNVLTVR
jgi:hypothetical protein